MPEVLHIENSAFDHPWSEEGFLDILRRRNYIGMVAEHGDAVLGFMVYEMHKARLQVLDLAVHPDHRRQGVGRQLVDKLYGKLSSHRRTRVELAVRETNLPGQLFLKACDFRAVAVISEAYDDTAEAAYLFRLEYREAEPAADGFDPLRGHQAW